MRRPARAATAGAATPKQAGEIRRSQIVGTYGPGALVDLLDHAVVIGGLDFWTYPNDGRSLRRATIQEPRLREALAGPLTRLDPPVVLSTSAPFRLPPAGDAKAPGPWSGVQALEMPDWFVCQKPACRALVKKNGLTVKKQRYIHECADGTASATVPVRFVAACRNGHLEDFPWVRFAHREAPPCEAPRLRLLEGASGDFSEVRVVCASCDASQALSRAGIADLQLRCNGRRPWLGRDGGESCDQSLRLLVRTASNAYFPQVVSALTLPSGTPERELADRVQEVWDVLEGATPETLPVFRRIAKVEAALLGWSDAQVLAAIEAVRRNEPERIEPLRTAEFRQLRAAPPERPGEIAPPTADFFARELRAPAGLPEGISRVVLIHKLREVRAQISFSRLEGLSPDLQGEFDLGVQSQRLGLLTDWLPASEIRGEGVFLELDEQAVYEWEQRLEVDRRDQQLRQAYESWALSVPSALPYPGARYYLLHSLAHLLISAISLHCGYPSAALRERIYCAPHDDDLPMAGILLSTGSTGAEGTLGGLVEEGRHLARHLQRALEMAALCSNDPVCGAHDPADDPAERYLEGAACHGCLFIAEPSCERFNLYLDRALVVPTLGQAVGVAFFGGGG